MIILLSKFNILQSTRRIQVDKALCVSQKMNEKKKKNIQKQFHVIVIAERWANIYLVNSLW